MATMGCLATMDATTRRCLAALSLTTLLAVSACGDKGSTPPDETSDPGTVTVTKDAEVEALDRPEQQQIDKATARKALPTRADMPSKAWLVDISPASTYEATYDPAKCADIELAGSPAKKFREEHRKVNEKARFSRERVNGGGIIATYVESYDEPYPTSIFDDAGAAIATCDEYTESNPSGPDSGYSAKAVTAPQLGDQTLAVRITSRRHAFYVDRMYVRSGHNLITVMVLDYDKDYDGKLMQEYAQGILDDLKKATS